MWYWNLIVPYSAWHQRRVFSRLHISSWTFPNKVNFLDLTTDQLKTNRVFLALLPKVCTCTLPLVDFKGMGLVQGIWWKTGTQSSPSLHQSNTFNALGCLKFRRSKWVDNLGEGVETKMSKLANRNKPRKLQHTRGAWRTAQNDALTRCCWFICRF